MLTIFKSLYDQHFGLSEYNVCILGLQETGKTRLLNHIKTVGARPDPHSTHHIYKPTVGLNVFKYRSGREKILFWDLGGKSTLRKIWENYYPECHGVVFVLDSRINEGMEVLKHTLTHPEMVKIPLIILVPGDDARVQVGEQINKSEIFQDREVAVEVINVLSQESIESKLRESIGKLYLKIKDLHFWISKRYPSFVFASVQTLFVLNYFPQQLCRLRILYSQLMLLFRNLLPDCMTSPNTSPSLPCTPSEAKELVNDFAEYMLSLWGVYRDYQDGTEKILQEAIQLSEGSQFYSTLIGIFQALLKQLAVFNAKQKLNCREINISFKDWTQAEKTFKGAIEQYSLALDKISDKKISKESKKLAKNMDQYKENTKIIYNGEEQLSKYKQCTINYDCCREQVRKIELKVVNLNRLKNNVLISYCGFESQFSLRCYQFAEKSLDYMEYFFLEFNAMQRRMHRVLLESVSQIKEETCSDILLKRSTVAKWLERMKSHCSPSEYQDFLWDLEEKRIFENKMYAIVAKFVKNRSKFLQKLSAITLGAGKFTKKCSKLLGSKWQTQFRGIESLLNDCMRIDREMCLEVDGVFKHIEQLLSKSKMLVETFVKEFEKMIRIQNNSVNQAFQIPILQESARQIVSKCTSQLMKNNVEIQVQYKLIISFFKEAVNEQFYLSQEKSCPKVVLQSNQFKLLRQSDHKINEQPIELELDLRILDQFTTLKKPLALNQSANKLNRCELKKDVSDKHAKRIQFLMKKVQNWDENEDILKCFNCGLAGKVILLGKMYITTHRICFHSNFKAAAAFLNQTFINLPKKDIVRIYKPEENDLLKNSLTVQTINGDITFTSFFSRNAVNQFLKFFFNTSSKNEIEQIELNEGDELEEIDQTEGQLKNFPSREPLLKDYPYYTICEKEFSFKGLTALTFFNFIDSDQQAIIKDTVYSSFAIYYNISRNHTDISITPWSVNPTPESIVKKNYFTRELGAIVPVPKSGIPFMPKTSRVDEEQRLIFVSPSKYVIEGTIRSSGIPYSTSFVLNTKKTIQEVLEGCRMKIEMYVQFTENVVFRRIIEYKVKEESIRLMEDQSQKIDLYLRSQDFTQKKPQKEKKDFPEVTSSKKVTLKQKKIGNMIEIKVINADGKTNYLVLKLVVGVALLLLLLLNFHDDAL